jgi:membrane-bound lytic murein transglycosylase D
MILAAALIGRNPELYGFTVSPSVPLAYESVEIPGALDLKIIAEWAGIDVVDLRELNPELRRTTTPGVPHALRVPIGTAAPVRASLAGSEVTFRTFRTHSVRSGESLSVIARQYGTTVAELMEANGLRSTRLNIRQELVIPTRFTAALPSTAAAEPVSSRAAAAGPATYRVRRGDTLSAIARQFSTTVSAIKQLNGLRSDVIRAGDLLRIRR